MKIKLKTSQKVFSYLFNGFVLLICGYFFALSVYSHTSTCTRKDAVLIRYVSADRDTCCHSSLTCGITCTQPGLATSVIRCNVWQLARRSGERTWKQGFTLGPVSATDCVITFTPVLYSSPYTPVTCYHEPGERKLYFTVDHWTV